MKPPEYRNRTPKQLKEALEWGLEVLSLTNWTVDLYLENWRQNDDLVDLLVSAVAACCWDKCHLKADIGLNILRAQQLNEDPCFCMFHEIVHIGMTHETRFGSGTLEETAREQFINCVAGALYKLWQVET